MRVHTLERMRRIFVLVLLATLFGDTIDQTWSRPAHLWLRRLGGKFGRLTDAGGPDILLAGISAACVTIGTLRYADRLPFPKASRTDG